MEMSWESSLFVPGAHKGTGMAKITDFSPRYSNSGIKEFEVTVSLDIPAFVQPDQPNVRLNAKQHFELFQTIFIYGAQCDLRYGAGKIAQLLYHGGMYNGSVRLRGTITDEVIQFIENSRKGSDVSCRFDFQVAIEQRRWWVVKQENNIVSEYGIASYQGELRSGWDVKLAASDWISEFLPGLKYDEGPFYLEMPRLPANMLYGSARKHMEAGLLALKSGGAGYRTVPVYCLNALDALSKSLGYNNFGHVLFMYPESEMSERKGLMKKFQAYINRWRHDQTSKATSDENIPLITYEEAMFVYITAAYLLQLIAKHTPPNKQDIQNNEENAEM